MIPPLSCTVIMTVKAPAPSQNTLNFAALNDDGTTRDFTASVNAFRAGRYCYEK